MVEESRLREGYKTTDLGIIPSDWEVVEVKEAYGIYNNLRLPISGKIRETIQGKYPYYGPTGIQDYINEYRLDGEYSLIGEDGDHFLKWRNMPMTLLVTGKFNVNNHAHVIKGLKNHTEWFYWYFYHRDITAHLSRQGAGRYKLNKRTLETLKMAIPSLLEQKAISNALSDTNNLIQSLENLIDKKKKIKQGAMQQLLTGKKRLPGFSAEWEVKKLGEVADIRTGKRNNQDKVSDGLYPFFVRSQDVERINTYSYEGEAVLVPGEGGIGNIFHYINGKFEVHQRVYKISDFLNVSGKYVYYYMKQSFGAHAMKNTVKATVDSLRLPTFQEFELKIPNNFEEQKAIVQVLSDMDAEIEALEEKLEKVKTIKQGMMQKLLTGRIRLI